MGRVPIVGPAVRRVLYDDLPVVYVDDWKTVTAEFLEAQWARLHRRLFNADKLWMPWWVRHVLLECLSVP